MQQQIEQTAEYVNAYVKHLRGAMDGAVTDLIASRARESVLEVIVVNLNGQLAERDKKIEEWTTKAGKIQEDLDKALNRVQVLESIMSGPEDAARVAVAETSPES